MQPGGLIHRSRCLFCWYSSRRRDTHPPMESGRYVSWFSSTFRAVNFFSEPEITGEDAERERSRESERQTGPKGAIDHHSPQQRREEYPLRLLNGLIWTVINTIISWAVIDFWLDIWTQLIRLANCLLRDSTFPCGMKWCKFQSSAGCF